MNAAVAPFARFVLLAGVFLVGGCRAPRAADGVPATVAVTSPAPTIPLAAAPPDLAGRWESTTISSSGFGYVLDLASNGTHGSGFVVMLDGNYSVRGDRILSSVDGLTGTDDVPFRVADDTMWRGAEEVLRLDRVGRPVSGSDPIVGVWTYKHYVGARAYERYGADGRWAFRLAMAGPLAAGKWTFSNGMRLVLDGKDPTVLHVLRDGDNDTLTLSSNLESRTMRRVDRWYEFPLSGADVEAVLAQEPPAPSEK